MRGRARSAPLLHTIAVRLAGIASGVVVALILATVFRYAGDLAAIRRASLGQQADEVFSSMRLGRGSSFAKLCAEYPQSYGYRLFDARNEVTEQVNGDLFPLMPRYRSGRPELSVSHRDTGVPENEQWFMTKEADVGGRQIWIHVTMIGDPAGLWRWVLLEKILDHVAIPVMIIFPALSLAVFWALRSSLQPLTIIAEQARRLAIEAEAGAPLQSLRADELPLEAMELVGAINVLLGKVEGMLDQQKQFTANAAHELRTPLAVLLLQISRLPPSRAVGQLKADVVAMSRLVDQLLRLAQAEQLARSGFAPCDLREIARGACEEMAMIATARGRFLEFDEAADPVMVSCNPEFIGTAIRNIIENGLRAAPDGSAVAVAVEADGRITVGDRGPGIPDSEKALVFQRFWRRERRSGEGAGIGLALACRIMDLHGGHAWVEDREGGGARIVLSFGTTKGGNAARSL